MNHIVYLTKFQLNTMRVEKQCIFKVPQLLNKDLAQMKVYSCFNIGDGKI